MKRFIQSYGISAIIVAIYAFIKLPVLRLDFLSFISVLIIFFGIAGILDMMLDRGEHTSKLAKYNFGIAIVLIIFNIVAPFITSSPILHAKAYRNLIGEVKESKFTKDVSPVSVSDIRLVDEDMAMRLGDKKIGEDPALGSVAKLGQFHIQNVNGELYWVAPLVHRDIIKWITSLDGTDGYVMVSASNPQDVRLVQEIDKKPVKIVYQPEAYFLQDLHRHMYLKGIVNAGMTDFTFEIDDDGNPYWFSRMSVLIRTFLPTFNTGSFFHSTSFLKVFLPIPAVEIFSARIAIFFTSAGAGPLCLESDLRNSGETLRRRP